MGHNSKLVALTAGERMEEKNRASSNTKKANVTMMLASYVRPSHRQNQTMVPPISDNMNA